MSIMTTQEQVIADKDYSVAEAAELLDLTGRHLLRLINDNHFEGAYRLAPVPKSPYRIPGSAIIAFIEKRRIT